MTGQLSSAEVAALRDLFREAWAGDAEEFTNEDWDHATGGVHFIREEGGEIVAHAAVVERQLDAGRESLATGYVEAVATRPSLQRRGYGSDVMREVGAYIDETFQLGALDTGNAFFYERMGWLVWKGLTFVRTESGLVRTAAEDGQVLVRLTPSSPELDLTQPISCDWRPGDVW